MRLDFKPVLPLAAAWLAMVQPAPAGEKNPPAARVRVTLAENRYVGRLVEVGDETLTLERPDGEQTERLSIRKREIQSLEVSRAPSRKRKGVWIGSLVGLGAAVAIGVAAGDECQGIPDGPANWGNFSETLSSNSCVDHGEASVLGGILTIPLGALLGYAIAPGEKWGPAGPSELTVAPIVSSRGAGLQLRLSF